MFEAAQGRLQGGKLVKKLEKKTNKHPFHFEICLHLNLHNFYTTIQNTRKISLLGKMVYDWKKIMLS